MTPPDPNVHLDDAALLDDLRRAATTIQPDPAFADRLRATLDAAAPRSLAEPPAAWRPAPTMAPPRPVVGPSATRRPRRTSHLATIAAILAILLVGYGALSLSGRSPSGLRLSFSKQPQASAQGVTTETNPIVGTWVTWANAFSTTNMISSLMTFQPDGSLILQLLYERGPQTAYGTWTTDGDTVSFIYVITLDTSYEDLDLENVPLVPILAQSSGTIRVTNGGRTWEDEGTGGLVLYVDREGNPVTEHLPAIDSDPQGTIDQRPPSRLDDVLANSATLTPEQHEALDVFFGGSDFNASASPSPVAYASTPAVESPPMPTSTALPTVTPMPNVAAVGLTPTLEPDPSPSS